MHDSNPTSSFQICLLSDSSSHYLHSLKMPTKTRPVEKIAKAAAQCSVEVRFRENSDVIQANSSSQGCGIWQMRGFGLQLRSQGYVRKGVHETEGLFPCKNIQLSFRPIHILTIPRRLPLKRVEREHGFYPNGCLRHILVMGNMVCFWRNFSDSSWLFFQDWLDGSTGHWNNVSLYIYCSACTRNCNNI